MTENKRRPNRHQPEQHDASLVLTVHEVALELRLSDRKVWDLIRAGELPSIKVGGSRRVLREVLVAYMAKLAELAS